MPAGRIRQARRLLAPARGLPLLGTQSADRINLGRAPCGQIRRDEARRSEDHHTREKRQRLNETIVPQQPLSNEQGSCDEGEADREAAAHQDDTFPDYQANDLGQARSKRHPNPDLVRPLAHQEGDHTLDPHRRQHQCANAEKRQYGRNASDRRHRLEDHVGHPADLGDRQRAVELLHLTS